MIFGSALCLSTSGIGLRVIQEADGWQILFYRSLSMMMLVLAVLLFRPEPIAKRIKGLAANDVLLALVLGTGFCAYVFALLHTTIANALFIFSSAPFFAAVLGWIVLRERVALRTWIAIGAAMMGLAVMVGSGLAGGRASGNLLALWLPISYAITVILVRRSDQPDMLVALMLAAGVATVISFSFADTLAIPGRDVFTSVAMGIFQVGAGFILMILGARHVPAAQVGLIALVEPVLGPTWAWFTASEIPAGATLIGGGIILGAVAIDALVSIARNRRSKPRAT